MHGLIQAFVSPANRYESRQTYTIHCGIRKSFHPIKPNTRDKSWNMSETTMMIQSVRSTGQWIFRITKA